MFCDVCKNKEATVFLTQMIEGNVEKLNLCEPCSKLQGAHDPMGFGLADLLLGLGATHAIEKVSIACPVCGFSQNDFKKRGRLGCSACYEAFSEGLAVMLRNMHRGMVHIGKVPKKIAAAHQKATRLEAAKKALLAAITHEEYEKAAQYRDLVHQIESGALEEEMDAKNTTTQELLPPGELVEIKKESPKAPLLPPPSSTTGENTPWLL